jgi:hypothetical protein
MTRVVENPGVVARNGRVTSKGQENLVRAGITFCDAGIPGKTLKQNEVCGRFRSLRKRGCAFVQKTVKRTNRMTGASNQYDARHKGSLRETRKLQERKSPDSDVEAATCSCLGLGSEPRSRPFS